MKYDIISIGDCTIDAFVEVEEATIHADIHHEHQQICFSFADKIPYRSLIMLTAGNANNAAVSTSRLGLNSAFYGTIGKDLNGKIIQNALKSEKVSTEFLKVDKKLPTNFHVVLWFRHERTILIKHQAYDYALPGGIENTKWIYLTSIGQKGLSVHKPVVGMLKKNPQIKMAFNPGTFQLRIGLKKLLPLLKHTEILFVNKEEAEALLGREGKPHALAKHLAKTGAKTVVITDALNGSYCLADGTFYHVGVYPHVPYETTGCGDAFASAFTAARIYGLPIEQALLWGSRQGASVATKIGPQAGLLTKSKMLRDLRNAPKIKNNYPPFKVKILKK